MSKLAEHQLSFRERRANFSTRIAESTLAALNDSGKTFLEIADIIESEPPGLFVEEPK